MRFPTFLARQKYRFDIGQGFLALVNFAFVVIAASDKLTTLFHVPAKVLVPVLDRRNEMLSAVHSAATKQKPDNDNAA